MTPTTKRRLSSVARPVLALAVVNAVVVVAGVGLDRGWWSVNHPSAQRFPVRGIDVSHHQGAIDWRAVAAEPGVRFAYLKATEGGDWVDPRFLTYYRDARQAGLRVGAYHFFTFCRPPLDQARHFLSVLPRDPDALPPAVDLEFGGNCNANPTREALLRDLGLWLHAVESATGMRPIVYVTHEADEAFLAGASLPNPRWIRDIWREPAGPWALWQYSARGTVRGIDGPTDLDVLRDGHLPGAGGGL